jgi:hypothetical protein
MFRNTFNTDDQSKIFSLARVALVLDSSQTLLDEVLSVVRVLLVDDDLQHRVSKECPTNAELTHQVHRLGDKSTRHADVDGSLLPIAREDPDLAAGINVCHKDLSASALLTFIPACWRV